MPHSFLLPSSSIPWPCSYARRYRCTEDSHDRSYHVPRCERAARHKQYSCPQFFIFFLLQAPHPKLCLHCSIPVALNTSTATKHQWDKKCNAAIREQNRSLFLPVLTLTEPSKKRERNFWTRQDLCQTSEATARFPKRTSSPKRRNYLPVPISQTYALRQQFVSSGNLERNHS